MMRSPWWVPLASLSLVSAMDAYHAVTVHKQQMLHLLSGVPIADVAGDAPNTPTVPPCL